MPDTCEYEGCPLPAEGWVEAQWSVVDFVRYDMCHDHLWEAYEILSTQKVEDNFCICGVRYYPEEDIAWSLTSH